MIKPTIIFAIFLSLVCANAQRESLPADLRQHALTQYNASLFNPTFSLDRNNPQSISFWTRWQWQQVDADPTTLFLNYTRNLNESTVAGLGFFQHNTGIYFNTGGAVNYAYEIEFNRLIKLSVGANIFGFVQQLADTRFPVNPIPGIPQTPLSDDFILQVAPGFNLSVENFSMSLASENLFDYNFTDKISNTAKADKIFMGMASYDFPVMASDSTAYIRPAIYLRTIPEQQNQIGLNTLLSTQKYWAQVGYNNFYGISVGAGGTVYNRFSLGAVVEFGTSGSLNNTDPSFELVASYFLGKPENRREPVASGIDDTNESVVLAQEELTVEEMRERLKIAEEAENSKNEEEAKTAVVDSDVIIDDSRLEVDKKEEKRIAAEQKAQERQKRKETAALEKKNKEEQVAARKMKEEEAKITAAAEKKEREATLLAEKAKEAEKKKEEKQAKVAAAEIDKKEKEAQEVAKKLEEEEAKVTVATEKEEREAKLLSEKAEEAEKKRAEKEAKVAAAEAEKKEKEEIAMAKKMKEKEEKKAELAAELAKREAKEKEEADRLAKIAKEKDEKLDAQIARIEKQRKLDSTRDAKKMEAIEKTAALREQQRMAEVKEKELAEQRKKDSIDNSVKEEVIATQEEEITPQPGEKYQEVVNEDGLAPGFYLIANVFGTKKYFDAFMNDLAKKGIPAKSFFRSTNNYNYAYLERYDTIGEARKARGNKFNGKYAGKTWIFRAVKK